MDDLDARHSGSRRLWVFAAIAALVLHLVGAALAFANLGTDLGEGGLGANADAISVELASPVVDDDQLPPGPDADPTQASQQVAEQKAETRDTELPKDRPNEAEPDRIVTQSNSDKPEEPQVAAVETQAAIEQPAVQATSRKTLEDNAPEAEKAKAPIVGIGKDRLKLTAIWAQKISAYFKLHKRFPDGKNKQKSGTVKVKVVLNRLGHVMSVGVVQSSGDVAFDEAAISMIRRSDPVPSPPAALTQDQFSFFQDVDFTEPK
jgi:TonB family protein